MAKQVIHRLGTTAEHNNFIGAEGEWTHDVDLTTIRVHDGTTVGGFPLAKSDSQTLTNVDINSGTIDGTAIGVSDPSTGEFTNVTINGNLTVLGTTTSIETTDLIVDDKNITIANGAADATAADGSGITIDGANATMTYRSTEDDFNFNKAISTSGGVTATTVNTGQGDNELYAMDQNVRSTDSVAFEAIAVDSDTLVVDNLNARVGIGTASPASELDVVGNLTVSGNLTANEIDCGSIA